MRDSGSVKLLYCVLPWVALSLSLSPRSRLARALALPALVWTLRIRAMRVSRRCNSSGNPGNSHVALIFFLVRGLGLAQQLLHFFGQPFFRLVHPSVDGREAVSGLCYRLITDPEYTQSRRSTSASCGRPWRVLGRRRGWPSFPRQIKRRCETWTRI